MRAIIVRHLCAGLLNRQHLARISNSAFAATTATHLEGPPANPAASQRCGKIRPTDFERTETPQKLRLSREARVYTKLSPEDPTRKSRGNCTLQPYSADRFRGSHVVSVCFPLETRG